MSSSSSLGRNFSASAFSTSRTFFFCPRCSCKIFLSSSLTMRSGVRLVFSSHGLFSLLLFLYTLFLSKPFISASSFFSSIISPLPLITSLLSPLLISYFPAATQGLSGLHIRDFIPLLYFRPKLLHLSLRALPHPSLNTSRSYLCPVHFERSARSAGLIGFSSKLAVD